MTQRDPGATPPEMPRPGTRRSSFSDAASSDAASSDAALEKSGAGAADVPEHAGDRRSPDGHGQSAEGRGDAVEVQPTPAFEVEMPGASDAVGDDAGDSDAEADYGPPFTARSFGGELVWARCQTFEAKVLRIRPGEVVAITTKGRHKFTAMLTGGRAVLEIRNDRGSPTLEHRELLPGEPVEIPAEGTYRVVAMSEVEIFVVYGLGDG